VDAVLLGLLAGALAGASNVSLHVGLRRLDDVEAAALMMILIAFVMVALTAAAVQREPVAWEAIWPFLLLGVIGPGLSTILFVTAVSRAGASRSAVLANTFPLFATVLAITLLGESVRVALVVGTVLVVAGAIGLTLSGNAPSQARGWFFRIGMVAALLAALTIAGRDTAVRWIGEGDELSAVVASAATLLTGSATLVAFVLFTGRGRNPMARMGAAILPFALVGLLTGVTTLAIFEALERGQVTVVSPLIGTAALWTLAFSVLVLRGSEGLGRRVVISAGVVAAGVALIGATGGSG
jgi:DME family drug/metabolite transporter